MSDVLKTVLLLALPASGKSEVRRYLKSLSPTQVQEDFHMGPTVQLDDFPYVHMMRRVDEALIAKGKKGVFFEAPDRSFSDPRDWGTLIELLNEDHDDLVNKRIANLAEFENSAAELLMRRIDCASVKVGAAARIEALGEDRADIRASLEEEAKAMLQEKHDNYPDSLDGKTLVIEFARGGKDGSSMPLEAPFGYGYSLSRLSPALLENASILYVWVTPEESRRKNEARTDPNDPGSILHHGVPLHVMLNDYGCDDMDWLEQNSGKPGTLEIKAHDRSFQLPIGRFDNRVDKTSFVREEPKDWAPEAVSALHAGLKAGFDKIVGA